jgi:hypothetical protein
MRVTDQTYIVLQMSVRILMINTPFSVLLFLVPEKGPYARHGGI